MYQITLTVSQNVLVNQINEHSRQSVCLRCPPAARTHDLRWSLYWSIAALMMSWSSRTKFASRVFAGRWCHESLFHTHIAA